MNTQPAEPIVRTSGDEIELQGEPFLTIQGEGPYAGIPAVFIRTAGCQLDCPACFHGNTVIRMADFSTKLISEIQVGDKVLSYDEKKCRFVKRRVTAVMTRRVKRIYRLRTESNKRTFVTGEHPFLVRGKGWVEAKELEVGDKILHLSLSELRKLHNPMKDPDVAAKVSSTMKERYLTGEIVPHIPSDSERRTASRRMKKKNPMKNPATAIKGFLNRKDRGKMSSAEKFVLFASDGLGLKFVGGGDLAIGHKVPDFHIPNTNKIIEVWDCDQTKFLGRDKEWRKLRRKIYEDNGYEVLFLPVRVYKTNNAVGTRKPIVARKREKEINRIRKAIGEFIHNGEEVKEISKIDRDVHQKAWTRLAGTSTAAITVYNLEVEGTHTYIADTMVVHNCDTDYTSKRNFWKVESVIAAINRMDLGRQHGTHLDVVGLVVITGGEPFRQPIWKLVTALVHAGFKVQIETNGAAFAGDTIPSIPILSIICSPKTPNIHPAIEPFITAYKYVLDWQHVDPRDGLPSTSLMNQGRVYRPKDIDRYLMRDMIYVQPMDTGDPDRNKMNMQAAIHSCMKHGYRLSVQTHKIVGLP